MINHWFRVFLPKVAKKSRFSPIYYLHSTTIRNTEMYDHTVLSCQNKTEHTKSRAGARGRRDAARTDNGHFFAHRFVQVIFFSNNMPQICAGVAFSIDWRLSHSYLNRAFTQALPPPPRSPAFWTHTKGKKQGLIIYIFIVGHTLSVPPRKAFHLGQPVYLMAAHTSYALRALAVLITFAWAVSPLLPCRQSIVEW